MNKISSIIFIKNAIKYNYPFLESIKSFFNVSDELIILEGFSNDGTYEKLKELECKYKKIKIKRVKTLDNKGNKLDLNNILKDGINLSQNEWCLIFHPDEILLETDIEELKNLICTELASKVDGFSFNFLHFFETTNHLLSYPTEVPNEMYFFQNAIRLFKKSKNTEFFGNGWEVNRYKGNYILNPLIKIYHYHFLRDYSILIKEFQEQPNLYHFLPRRYEDYLRDKKFKRGFYNDIIPFYGYQPKVMNKYITYTEIKLNTKPKILFILDQFYQVNNLTNFLADIYNTEILQKSYELHQIVWNLGNVSFDNNNVISHYLHLPSIDFEKFNERVTEIVEGDCIRNIFELVKPDITVLIGRINFFLPFLPLLYKWKGNILGWFELNIEIFPIIWNSVLQVCDKIAVFSDFAKNYIKDSEVIKLGVDFNLYKRYDSKDKCKLREKLNLPTDAFIFLCRDQNEKSILLTVDCFNKMCEQSNDPRKAYLYFNSYISPKIKNIIKSTKYSDKIFWVADYNSMSLRDNIILYNVADVLVSTSLGNGNGLFLMQAIACGLPCICPNNSIFNELIQDNGILCSTLDFPQDSIWGILNYKIPNTQEMIDLMLKVYDNKIKLSVSNISYLNDWNKVSQNLLNFLDKIKSDRIKNPRFEYSDINMIQV